MQLRAACLASHNAEQTRSESDKRWQETSCFRTGLEMADILGELNLDAETLVAAILYRAVREERERSSNPIKRAWNNIFGQ